MSSRKQEGSKNVRKGFLNRSTLIFAAAVVLLSIAIITMPGYNGGSDRTSSGEGDIVITKSEITETVKFFPVKIGKITMEVMAVKASDGTIRTAFNTCQVCNGSPRAYFKQEGDSVICQNCGNIFSLDMIEVRRGGCNPVPIAKDDKVEDEDTITISRELLEQNKDLFPVNWKK